jgi:hypothetical protein
MPYHVIAFTMAQVRQGALSFQRDLSAALSESKDLKVYSVSPFDLDERRRFKDRFGGDVVYFFNDAARNLIQQQGSDLQFAAEITDAELPKRRTLVVGIPE